MAFPLEGQTLVLTGRFASVDSEDARWALIAKGARVLGSVTKTTSALVAGEDAAPKLLAAAAKHQVPVLGEAALQALLQGETLTRARALGSGSQAPTQPLAGRVAVLVGAPKKGTQAALAARLGQLGAEVTRKVSAKTTLLLWCSPTADGLDALHAGIDRLLEPDVDALEAGAPLSQYLGRRDAPHATVEANLQSLHAELRDVDTGGERWDDQLSVTLHPTGRLTIELRELAGTPIEDHVRRVLLRADWPRVGAVASFTHAITFGS